MLAEQPGPDARDDPSPLYHSKCVKDTNVAIIDTHHTRTSRSFDDLLSFSIYAFTQLKETAVVKKLPFFSFFSYKKLTRVGLFLTSEDKMEFVGQNFSKFDFQAL